MLRCTTRGTAAAWPVTAQLGTSISIITLHTLAAPTALYHHLTSCTRTAAPPRRSPSSTPARLRGTRRARPRQQQGTRGRPPPQQVGGAVAKCPRRSTPSQRVDDDCRWAT
jgi:hypothetical protein